MIPAKPRCMKRESKDSSEYSTPNPEQIYSAAELGEEPPHQGSPTATASEAIRAGIVDVLPPDPELELPGEELLLAGDEEVRLIDAEYVGDDIPGGATPTPGQNDVDDIGRAYGVSAQGDGELTSSEALLLVRDLRRWELDPRSDGDSAERDRQA